MSTNYRNLEGVQEHITELLKEAQGRLELWKNVTFPTKKDGTPFKIMNKNFDGASYELWRYASRDWECVLSVCNYVSGKFVKDEISCYESVKYIKDKTKLEKTYNIIPETACFGAVYTYDLEDIKEAIMLHIEYLKKTIVQYEKQLEVSEQAYNTFKDEFMAACKKLKEATGYDDNSSLCSAIRNTVINTYQYH